MAKRPAAPHQHAVAGCKPSPGSVLGLALATSKRFALRPRQARLSLGNVALEER